MTPQPKPERIRDTAYMKWIKALGCTLERVSGSACIGATDPHHVKPAGGGIMGGKVSDRRCIPLCRQHHLVVEIHPATFRDGFEALIIQLNREYNSAHPPKPKKQIQISKVYGLKVKCSCRRVHVIPLSKAIISKKSVSFTCATRNTRESVGL